MVEACKILNFSFQFGMNKVPNNGIKSDGFSCGTGYNFPQARRRLCLAVILSTIHLTMDP